MLDVGLFFKSPLMWPFLTILALAAPFGLTSGAPEISPQAERFTPMMEDPPPARRADVRMMPSPAAIHPFQLQ